MTRISIPYKFTPRFYQIPIFEALDSGIKRIIMIFHRRAGKDLTCFNVITKKALEEVGMYFYIFPTYTQWRKILWDWIKKDGMKFIDHAPQEIREWVNNQEMKMTLINGSIIQVVWSDRIDLIVWTNPKGVVFSEYSLQNPKVRDFIRPILAENGWRAIFNYTPRGENHAYDLYEFAKNDPNWFVSHLTVDDTKAIPQDVLDQERKEIVAKNGDDSIFMQEYYVSFQWAIQWAYYWHLLKQLEERKQIGKMNPEQWLEVYTAWDLGMSDATSIWFFQLYGKEVRLLHYYENSWEALSHYWNYVNNRIRERKMMTWTCILPHDIQVRELWTGKSRLETLQGYWLQMYHVVPALNVMDWIEAVRQILWQCWFDEEWCKDWLSALRNYRKVYDEMRKTYKSRPEHDWASHWADAFRYLALWLESVKPYRSPWIISHKY